MPKSEGEELHPVRESREAFDLLTSYSRDRRIETSILRMGDRVRAIVPECFAMSLGLEVDGLTYTFVAESREVALLDAIQYLDGGPCVTATQDGTTIATTQLPTDEGRWQLFARGWGPTGVASTLSLPVMSDDRAVGSVNLYAATPTAFDGHHEELADACGAWARGAVTNADLSFSSRLRAAAAPRRLRETADIDAATGVVAAHQNIDMETAATRIRDAAVRAGVRGVDVARFILDSNPASGDRNGPSGH